MNQTKNYRALFSQWWAPTACIYIETDLGLKPAEVDL